MSVPPSPPPDQPSPQAAVPPPPPPVRTAITLVWVRLAVVVLTSVLTLAVPGLREQALSPAESAPGVPAGIGATVVTIAVVTALVGVLFAVAYAVVVAIFLRRGHRWARVVVLVVASIGVFSTVTLLLQAVLSVVSGPSLLVPTPPTAVSLVSGVVSTALHVVIVVLLFRAPSRAWFGERTAQRRWAAEQRRAVQGY